MLPGLIVHFVMRCCRSFAILFAVPSGEINIMICYVNSKRPCVIYCIDVDFFIFVIVRFLLRFVVIMVLQHNSNNKPAADQEQ